MKKPNPRLRAGVLRCLMKGLRNHEAAKELGISHDIVKKYIADLCRDYGVSTSSGIPRVKLAVAIFNAGHCPCSACHANTVRAGNGMFAAASPEMPETVHMERRRPGSESVLALHGHRPDARASNGL